MGLQAARTGLQPARTGLQVACTGLQAHRCQLSQSHLQSQRAAEDDSRRQVRLLCTLNTCGCSLGACGCSPFCLRLQVDAYHARFGQLHETLQKSAEARFASSGGCNRGCMHMQW